jgi:hypothetical protein
VLPHSAEVLVAGGPYSPLAADALVTGVVSGWGAILILWAMWIVAHRDTDVSQPTCSDVAKDVHDHVTAALRSVALDHRDVRIAAARQALARLDRMRGQQVLPHRSSHRLP